MSEGWLRLRSAREEDANFLLNSWLKTQRWVGDHAQMDAKAYYGDYKQSVVARLSDGRTIVACAPEDEWEILGYVCHSGSKVHMLYTKLPYRGFGIARKLIQFAVPEFGKTPVEVTSMSKTWNKELQDKYKVRYVPWT